MRRFLLFLALAMLCTSAVGQNLGLTPEQVAQEVERIELEEKALKYQQRLSRFTLGIGYRYTLGVLEQRSLTDEELTDIDYSNKETSALLINYGYHITNDWVVSLEAGLGDELSTIYVNAKYFYGNKIDRWFNYVNLGVVSFRDVHGHGLYTGIGGGYRTMMLRRLKLDFTVGLDYMQHEDGDYRTEDRISLKHNYSRLGITLGVGLSF